MAVRERGHVSASRSPAVKRAVLYQRGCSGARTGQEQNDRNRRDSPKDY